MFRTSDVHALKTNSMDASTVCLPAEEGQVEGAENRSEAVLEIGLDIASGVKLDKVEDKAVTDQPRILAKQGDAKKKSTTTIGSKLKKPFASRISQDDVMIIWTARENQMLLLSDALIQSGADKDKAIFEVAYNNHVDLVRYLQEKYDASIDAAVRGAARGNHRALVDELIQAGADKNKAISEAAFGNHVDLVHHLQKKHGADIDVGVRTAARENHSALVDWLIQAGADKDQAMWRAAYHNHVDLVRHLQQDHGVSIDVAVRGAVGGNHRTLVDGLIQAGADKDEAMFSAAYKNHPDLVHHLQEKHGASLDAAIRGAARGNHCALVDELIQAGADKDEAMLEAALGNHVDLVHHLQKKHGADIDVAVGTAARENHGALVDWLIQAGADKNKAMFSAAYKNHTDLVHHLQKKHGATLDAAVCGAARGNHLALVDALIQAGADKDEAMLSAAYKNHTDLVRHLKEEHGASLDVAIRGAAQGNHRFMVDALIQVGADKDEAMFYAAYKNHTDLVCYLKTQYGASINHAKRGAAQGKHDPSYLRVLTDERGTNLYTSRSLMFFGPDRGVEPKITQLKEGDNTETPPLPLQPFVQVERHESTSMK